MTTAPLLSFINKLTNKVTSLVKRAVLTKVAKDDTDYQIVQVQYLGRIVNVESVSPYGISSSPLIDSTGIIFNILANEENQAGFFNIPQKRFKNLLAGELQTGNYLTRSSIKYAADGTIIINSFGKIEIVAADDVSITSKGNINIKVEGEATIESTQNLTIKAPQITLDGSVIITEDLNTTGDVIGAGINLTTHVHSDVTSGGDNTGPPV